MNFLILLDSIKAGEPFFLKSLFQSFLHIRNHNGIIVHADNIISRNITDEEIPFQDIDRNIRELNKSLVDLLADVGISSVGVHGYQKQLISITNDIIKIDKQWFQQFPHGVFLVLSNLIWNNDTSKRAPARLGLLTEKICSDLEIETLFVTNSKPVSDNHHTAIQKISGYTLPGEITPLNVPVFPLTVDSFNSHSLADYLDKE